MGDRNKQAISSRFPRNLRNRNQRRNENPANSGPMCTIFYLDTERNRNLVREFNGARCRFPTSTKPMGSKWKKNGGKASRLHVRNKRQFLTSWAQKSNGPLWLDDTTTYLKAYQRNRFCDCRIKFGNMIDDTTFAEHFGFIVDFAFFEHEGNELDLYLKGSDDRIRYKINVQYNQFRFLAMDVSVDGANVSAKQAFTLQGTPLIYNINRPHYAEQFEQASKFGLPLELEDIDTYRTLELNMNECTNSSSTINKITPEDIGKCRTVLIEVGDRQAAKYYQYQRREDWTYMGINELNRRLSKQNVNVYYCALKTKSVKEYQEEKADIRNNLFRIAENNFEVFYLLNVLTSSEVLLDQLVLDGAQRNLMYEMVRKVVSSNDIVRFTEAIKDTLYQRNQEAISIANTLEQSMRCFRNRRPNNTDRVPYIREIVITPSFREFKLPVAYELPKRFENLNPEYLLEVTIRDDDFRTLKKRMLTHPNPELFLKGFTDEMRQSGLMIGKWVYEMIGWSGRQIRKSSFWMYKNGASGLSAQNFRIHFLQFGRRISVLNKCNRAMELLNDEAITYRLSNVNIAGTDYWNCPQGRISIDLMKKLRGLESNCPQSMIPAAVFARIGIFRGIFITDISLPENSIKASTEMIEIGEGEYFSNSVDATVFGFSRVKNFHLTRQTICLLERCGVKPEVFLNRESALIVDALKIFLDSSRGWETLQRSSTFPFCDELEQNVGASLFRDPFIRRLLQDILLSKLLRLEYKTFLDLNIDHGCRVMGIVDETGILRRGQVYIRYSTAKDRTTIRTGKVLVTKVPCLEKGDIRIFEAVRSLEGTHFDFGNVIVFSSHIGTDSTGNQVRDWRLMGGYPLHDGLFTVLWCEDLLFNQEILPDCEPRRVASKPKFYRNQYDVFFDELANPAVGIMCNMHLAHADHEITDSSNDQDRKYILESLAMKIRTQLRFWDGGDRVKIHPRERVNAYPDFMKRCHRESERSHSSLGQLYKLVSQLRRYLQVSRYHEPKSQDHFFEIEGWKTFQQEAIALKEEFDIDLRRILQNWKLQNESEIFLKTEGELSDDYLDWADTGFFGDEHRRRERMVNKKRDKLFEKYRRIFQERLEPYRHLPNAEGRFVSACFLVSFNRGRTSGLSSFPWIHAKFVNNYFIQNPHPLSRIRTPLLLNYPHLENSCDTRAAYNGIRNLLNTLNGDISQLSDCYQYVTCLRDAIPDMPSEERPEGRGQLGCLMQFLENSCLQNRLQEIEGCNYPTCVKYLATSEAMRTVMFKPLMKLALFWDLCPFGQNCNSRSFNNKHDFEDFTIVHEILIRAPENFLKIIGELGNDKIKIVKDFVTAQTNVNVHVSVKFTKRKLHAFVFKCRANVSEVNYLEDFIMDFGFYKRLGDHLKTVTNAVQIARPQIEGPSSSSSGFDSKAV